MLNQQELREWLHEEIVAELPERLAHRAEMERAS